MIVHPLKTRRMMFMKLRWIISCSLSGIQPAAASSRAMIPLPSGMGCSSFEESLTDQTGLFASQVRRTSYGKAVAGRPAPTVQEGL